MAEAIQRRGERIQVAWLARWAVPSVTGADLIYDVTSSGAFLQLKSTDTPMEAGTAIWLRIYLPKARPVDVSGQVRWIGQKGLYGHGVGIEFDAPQSQVAAFLETRSTRS